jgi:hypothetical protein
VVLLPDNDQPGRDHVRGVVAILEPVARSIRILELPGLPAKGDVVDWLEAGHTADELRELLEAAPDANQVIAEWSGEAKSEDLDASVQRLASLRPADYDRARKTEAARLGIRTSALDEEVKRRRTEARPQGAGAGQENSLGLEDIEPWPDPVNGAEALTDTSAAIRSHIVLNQPQADAIALWCGFSYAIDLGDISPRLCLSSPVPRCGKTSLTKIISALVQRSLTTSSITSAAVFRTIEVARPTLVIDEADSFIFQNEELRGMLNSGHERRNAFVVRASKVSDGDYEPRRFTTWCPIVIALIGKLPSTLGDRSIEIRLQRKGRGEKVRRLRSDRLEHLEVLARKLARFIADTADRIKELDLEPPVQLNDRAADNWRPLLAIAHAAGGDWPERARKAALELSVGAGDLDTGERLLADLKAIFDAHGLPALFSETLVEELNEIEDAPWAELSRGRPLTKNKLARLLKAFGIVPKGTVRIDVKTSKGYERTAFDNAWRRYLPLSPLEGAVQTDTTTQVSKTAAHNDFQNVTSQLDVTFANPLKAAVSKGCDDVTVSKGGSREKEERKENSKRHRAPSPDAPRGPRERVRL